MVDCTVLSLMEHSIILRYEADGAIQAKIVPLDMLTHENHVSVSGQHMKVDESTLLSGTEYGLDVEVLAGDSCLVDYKLLSNALRNRGVWLPEHFKANTKAVQDACIAVAKNMAARLNRLADLEDIV